MNFTQTWLLLEEDSRSSAGRVQRRILPTGGRNFLLGLELPSRNRMLILRVSPESVQGAIRVADSRGLKIRMGERVEDPPVAEVELVLSDTSHNDIFDLLIEDIVEKANEPADEKVGVARFLSRLAEWQHILMRLPTGALGVGLQQGLWGELWVLREIIAPAQNLYDAINAWQGPTGSDQDFQLSNLALEVKTSTANSLDRIPIASERQLHVPDGVELVLTAISLDRRPGFGLTLPELVNNTRVQASDVGQTSRFDASLRLYGYDDAHEEYYESDGYTVLSAQQFAVRPGFPRIVPDQLESGVSDVNYSISAPACIPFSISDHELAELIKGAQ